MDVVPRRRPGSWLRAALAALVVLAFWGALAGDLWPEVRALGATGRGGAGALQSAHLEVRNHSAADAALVQQVVVRLEGDLRAIADYVGRAPVHGVPVLILDGTGPAATDGTRLLLYHERGRIDLSTAPVLLALLGEGSLAIPGLSLFAEGSYALHVAEAAGRTAGLLGASTDAWVVMMAREGTLLPVDRCREAAVPRSARERGDAIRALLEGASLMRWLAAAHGMPALQALRDGQSLEDLTGMSIAAIESAWLDSVAGTDAPTSCLATLPERSPLRPYCDVLAP
jgi:hypothetical protein